MTTPLGFRYPAIGNVPNVPQDIQNLATDLDNYLSPIKWQGRQATTTTPLNTAGAYTTIVMDTLDVAIPTVAIGGGSFRAPANGIYRVSGHITFGVSTAGERGGQVALNSNGLPGTIVRANATPSGLEYMGVPLTLVQCAVNDVLSLQAFQTTGGALSTGAGSTLVVELVARL